jgi:hypothetical protein
MRTGGVETAMVTICNTRCQQHGYPLDTPQLAHHGVAGGVLDREGWVPRVLCCVLHPAPPN